MRCLGSNPVSHKPVQPHGRQTSSLLCYCFSPYSEIFFLCWGHTGLETRTLGGFWVASPSCAMLGGWHRGAGNGHANWLPCGHRLCPTVAGFSKKGMDLVPGTVQNGALGMLWVVANLFCPPKPLRNCWGSELTHEWSPLISRNQVNVPEERCCPQEAGS